MTNQFYYAIHSKTLIGIVDGKFLRVVNSRVERNIYFNPVSTSFTLAFWLVVPNKKYAFTQCSETFAQAFIDNFYKQKITVAAQTNSKVGFLIRSNPNYLKLPQNFKDELDLLITNKYGRDVLILQHPTPKAIAEFEELVDAYSLQYEQQKEANLELEEA